MACHNQPFLSPLWAYQQSETGHHLETSMLGANWEDAMQNFFLLAVLRSLAYTISNDVQPHALPASHQHLMSPSNIFLVTPLRFYISIKGQTKEFERRIV